MKLNINKLNFNCIQTKLLFEMHIPEINTECRYRQFPKRMYAIKLKLEKIVRKLVHVFYQANVVLFFSGFFH